MRETAKNLLLALACLLVAVAVIAFMSIEAYQLNHTIMEKSMTPVTAVSDS